MAPISGSWLYRMRSARPFTVAFSARSGANRVIASACSWWTIIIATYWRSASFGGGWTALVASDGDSVEAEPPGVSGAMTGAGSGVDEQPASRANATTTNP